MAGIGYGLRGFASGLQTGMGLGLERKRMDMLEAEQKRAEKLIKDQEEAKMTWYTDNEDLLKNFGTQPQDVRNSLIFESVNFEEYWHKYLVDSEKAIKAGEFEELKHLNDIAEEKIKLEAKMIEMGITADKGAFGEMYTEKKMDYIKKLKMGALTNKPIGTAMYEERFGKLPAETEKPKIIDYNTGLKYLTSIVNVAPENWESAKKGLETKYGLDFSAVTQESLKTPADVAEPKAPTLIPFKTLQAVKDSFKHIKDKAQYSEAVASYDASKEAKASGWTPPAFETGLIKYIKEVESAIWADFVNKNTGKMKDKSDVEEYNDELPNYLKLIEEAKKAGIDISQFQAFIPYKELYWGMGDPLLTKESW